MKKVITLYAILAMPSCFASDMPQLKKISWGIADRQGKRDYMEDTYAVIENINKNPHKAFFGLYDGHGGIMAAITVAGWGLQNENQLKPLHKWIIDSKEAEPKRSIDAYEGLNREFIRGGDNSGTAALTAFIEEKDGKPILNLAWAGDSRAILIDKDGTVLDATEDHKPEAPQEAERIFNAHGTIFTTPERHVKELYVDKNQLDAALERNTHRAFRTVGGLSLSRSIGDSFDKLFKNERGEQMGTIATPEVKQIELNPNATALIMACDGLWDVISNHEAATFVSGLLADGITSGQSDYSPGKKEQHEIQGTNETAKAIAAGLRDLAYASGSSDNITVLLVLFEWQKPIQVSDLTAIVTQAQEKLKHDDAKILVSQWIEALNAIDQHDPVANNAAIEPLYDQALDERYKESLGRKDGTDDKILTHLYQLFGTAYYDKQKFAQIHLTVLKDYLEGNQSMSDDSETESSEGESDY